MTFKSGTASVYVDMYLNVYERGRLTATCTATSAVSDEHTVVSATKILLDEGTAPSALAQIYDKYAGKDPTKEYNALSMISNVVPRNYGISSQYNAEIEIPSDIQALGDKNLEELTFKSVTSIPAVQRYNQSGNYYALCATVSTKDPATQDINAATQSGIIGRRFYLLNNSGTFSRWLTGTSSSNFVNKSFSFNGSYTSYVRSASTMSPSDGKYTVYFDFSTTVKEWCEQYGQDWSILYLNYSGNGTQYFKYSNEVKRENLYGFFSVAVFKEQVSDLNYYFKNSTGAGCITMHESEEIRGSKVYNFFGGLSEKGILGKAAGRIGMIFCELVNDENAIYHSYFFFMDGTSDLSFVSNGGATSATDTDSAAKNTLQKIGDDIGDFFAKLLDKANDSVLAKILAIGLPILLVLLLVVLAIRLVKWLLRK